MSQDNNLQAAASPVTITTVNGKDFVSGLFWQPLTRPRAYMKEAREIGKREGMDIVAIRHSTIMQAGFVAKNQGVLKGMYSLAAALAGRLGSSWLGVFELDDDQYAFVAVNDGAIVPGCDIVGSREVVQGKLAYIYSFFTWEKVYAPAAFDFGGEAVDIKTLLVPSELKKEYRLKQLTFGLTRKELVLGGLLLTATAGGLWGFQTWQAAEQKRVREERIRAEQIRQQQLAELNAKAKRQQSVKALEHPWAKMPAAEDFLKSCITGLNAMPLTLNGWAFAEGTCDGRQVSGAYTRKGNATVNEFAAGAQMFPAVPDFSEAGEKAKVSAELKLMYGGDDPLQPEIPMLSAFQSHFQKQGIKPKLDLKKVEVEKPKALPGQPAAQEEAKPLPDWKTFTFSFNTEMAPERVFEGLNASGIRFTELGVKMDLDEQGAAKLTWNVAGEIYAK